MLLQGLTHISSVKTILQHIVNCVYAGMCVFRRSTLSSLTETDTLNVEALYLDRLSIDLMFHDKISPISTLVKSIHLEMTSFQAQSLRKSQKSSHFSVQCNQQNKVLVLAESQAAGFLTEGSFFLMVYSKENEMLFSRNNKWFVIHCWWFISDHTSSVRFHLQN